MADPPGTRKTASVAGPMPNLDIPTAQPLAHEPDARLKPIRYHGAGDRDAIRRAMQAVANQRKEKPQ